MARKFKAEELKGLPPEPGNAPGGGRLGEMMRAARKAQKLSLREVSRVTGYSPSYLSQIEAGLRRAPKAKVTVRLAKALGMDPMKLRGAAEWERTPQRLRQELEKLAGAREAARRLGDLISGKAMKGKRPSLDAMYRSGELKQLIDKISPSEDAGRGAGTGRGKRGKGDAVVLPLAREVPLINSVAAGYPREFTDLGYPARVADEYIRVPEVEDPDAFAARVVGESMEPDYREGDIVVFSPARPVKNGMDCFARLEPDQETTFKRVFFERKGGKSLIRLEPLNPLYKTRVLAREEVAGLYAAVSVTRPIAK